MKKIKTFKDVSFIIMLFAFIGCTHDRQLMYKDDPRIYFVQGRAVEYNFSTKEASFTTDTFYIPLRIMGTSKNTERSFSVVIDDSSTAKKGYHFDFGAQVVAADSFSRNLPVYVYRRSGLKDSVVNAYLTIGETADFKPGYSDKYLTIDSLNKLHYKITLSDQLLKPSRWDTYWVNYFGDYSKTKFLFLIQSTGRTDWNSSPFPQDMNFLVQTAKFALYNYEQANGHLIDENNQRVEFP